MKKDALYQDDIEVMNRVILQLGGNRGDVLSNFEYAKKKLEQFGVKVLMHSNIYETEPWGHCDKRWFLNQVIEVEAPFDPEELLDITQGIEKELGRAVKKSEWLYEGRPIDIDILFFNEKVLHSDRLMIPHPHIRFRKFVLVPLCDQWKDLIHPEFATTMEHLLFKCSDEGGVRLYDPERELNKI